jgi:hypothetical protein
MIKLRSIKRKNNITKTFFFKKKNKFATAMVKKLEKISIVLFL